MRCGVQGLSGRQDTKTPKGPNQELLACRCKCRGLRAVNTTVTVAQAGQIKRQRLAQATIEHR